MNSAAEKTDNYSPEEAFIFMVSELFMLNMCQLSQSNNDMKLQRTIVRASYGAIFFNIQAVYLHRDFIHSFLTFNLKLHLSIWLY